MEDQYSTIDQGLEASAEPEDDESVLGDGAKKGSASQPYVGLGPE